MGLPSRVLHRIVLPLPAAIAALTFAFAAPSEGAELRGRVVGVADGDTLTVLVDHEAVRIRLSDIDAPERGQSYGANARQSLAELCAGRMATVVSEGHDRYGRTLGVVACGGVDANREQVRRGLAWVYARYARRDSPLYEVEREAREQGRGLWQGADPLPPWLWRSRHKARPAQWAHRADRALRGSGSAHGSAAGRRATAS
ncbi:MAG TPA: thermonuclease family protein [Burkholderiales bacterium]|nr:thermonuclease family protein [Burkholderiales bacterium]